MHDVHLNNSYIQTHQNLMMPLSIKYCFLQHGDLELQSAHKAFSGFFNNPPNIFYCSWGCILGFF
jgi:hypothetical protein